MQQTIAPPLTYDDLLETPYDRRRYEIIDGEMYVSTTPPRPHQEVSGRIFRVLHAATDGERRGSVFFAPVDVRLSPYDIVQPDLLFYRRDRQHIHTPSGLIEGPPDIVVEIFSPTSRSRDLVKKAKLYAWGEVPEYWQANPAARDLTILGLNQGHYEPVLPEGGLLRSLVLPHLRIDVAALFDGI